MGKPRRPVGPHFHEFPLVLFTTLGIAGAGVGSAHLLQVAVGGAAPALSPHEGVILTVSLLVGVVLSAGHLGKPLRGHLALKGLGRSPLSNEILALGIALGAGVLGLLLREGVLPWTVPGAGYLLGPVGLLASLGSVAFLLALGILYSLPGQLSWRGPAVGHPLVLGTAWGLLLGLGGSQPLGDSTFPTLLGVVLAADGALVILRMRSLWRDRGVGEASYPQLRPWGTWGLGARLLLSGLVAPLTLLSGWWSAAVLALSLALFLDRMAFYALAVVKTTESEVARVEALFGKDLL